MFSLCKLFSASLIILSSTLSASAASPPRDVALIYPASDVSPGTTVEFGFYDAPPLQQGITRNVTIAVYEPDGSRSSLMRLPGDPSCSIGTGSISKSGYNVSTPGT
jgi:hypothetical protein